MILMWQENYELHKFTKTLVILIIGTIVGLIITVKPNLPIKNSFIENEY